MKRKFIALTTAFLMIFSLILPVSAAPTPVSNPQVYATLSTTTVSADSGSASITYYIYTSGAAEGETISDISVNISNTGELNILSGASTVENATVGYPYTIIVDIPSGLKSSTQYFTFEFTFKCGGVDKSTKKYVPLYISSTGDNADTGSVSIQNLVVPSIDIIAGTKGTITADIVNSSPIGGTDAKAVLRDTETNKVLAEKFVGAISPDSAASVEIPFTIKETGSYKAQLAIVYKENGTEKTVSSDFTLNIVGSTPLKISGLAYEKTAHTDELQTLTFELINTGDESFLDAQAYIYNGEKQISSAYIGTSNAHEKTDGTITYTLSKAASEKLTLKVQYTNTAGKKLVASKDFDVKVIAASENNDAGSLKIQSITAPASIPVDELTQIPFAVTNPTKTAITGAEITLYDMAGNTVDSLFISQMDPCTSVSYNFNVLASGAGTETYTAKLVYENNDKEKHTDSKSFTLKITTREEAEEEAEKPSDMRIAKVKNPSQIYTGSNTEIPYTIINSGKGSAYNVEVYLTDSQGNELAREYIGNITASTKYEDNVKIKINEEGEQELTFNVYSENADGTSNTISKAFSQKIVAYRASILDVTGLEYIFEGSQSNVSFSVQNSGTLNMLNAEATLTDSNGQSYGSAFIGTIEANSRKEKIKFKNVMFNDTSLSELTITVTYENEDADVFSFSNSTAVTVNAMDNGGDYYPGGDVIIDDGKNTDVPTDENGEIIGYDDLGNPIYAESGLPVWAIVLIAVGGVAVVAVVVIIIVKKKKKAKSDDDDMDYYYAQEKNTENSENK